MLSFSGSAKCWWRWSHVTCAKASTAWKDCWSSDWAKTPQSGTLYVFCNRLKILYFDGTGLWVLTKRLEKGTFSWPRASQVNAEQKLRLRPEAFALLTDGIDLRGARLQAWYKRMIGEEPISDIVRYQVLKREDCAASSGETGRFRNDPQSLIPHWLST
jgi:transposase